jgi:hypothetical protein
MKATFFSFLLLALGSVTGRSQGTALTPQHQKTMLEYAGPQTNTPVPIALLNKDGQIAAEAAKWLSGVRRQPLATYSFSPTSEVYVGKAVAQADSIFTRAEAMGQTLYFIDCDALFGKPASTPEEKLMQERIILLAKKYRGATLFQCAAQPAYFALAKARFGMVSLD